MAALAISTFGAFAQTETRQGNAACEQTTECCKTKKEGREKKGAGLFNGIELTPEQQQQVDALKAERKAAKQSREKANKEAKAQEKKAYDEKLAQILTPEQYAQYKANAQKIEDRKKHIKVKSDKVRKGSKPEKTKLSRENVKKAADKN